MLIPNGILPKLTHKIDVIAVIWESQLLRGLKMSQILDNVIFSHNVLGQDHLVSGGSPIAHEHYDAQ